MMDETKFNQLPYIYKTSKVFGDSFVVPTVLASVVGNNYLEYYIVVVNHTNCSGGIAMTFKTGAVPAVANNFLKVSAVYKCDSLAASETVGILLAGDGTTIVEMPYDLTLAGAKIIIKVEGMLVIETTSALQIEFKTITSDTIAEAKYITQKRTLFP